MHSIMRSRFFVIVTQTKHSIAKTGAPCFYLNCDDIDTHRKAVSYFIKNNMISKTAKGRFYSISFLIRSTTDKYQ